MHLMIDLETLDTAPSAAIVHIGAVFFDPMKDEVEDKSFLINVDPDDCIKKGLTVQWSAIHWWIGQGSEARASLPGTRERGTPGTSLSTALGLLGDFSRTWARWGPSGGEALDGIWAHGPSFDIAILNNAARAVGRDELFSHRLIRDTRTLDMLSPGVIKPAPAVSHNALADAISQALWVQAMMKNLRQNSEVVKQ